jgi:glycosyltransferase involved in cell wall biosynthesis
VNVLNICLSTDLKIGGGTGERTLQMSYALARKGVTCTILELGSAQSSQAERMDHDVKIISLPCLLQRFYLPKPANKMLRRLVCQADIIHLIGHWTPLNAIVARLARQSRTPYVICPAGALPSYGRSKLLKWIYNLFVGNAIVAQASAHIAITEDEVGHFSAYNVDASGVRVIANGIGKFEGTPTGDRQLRETYGLPDNSFLLFVGRLNQIKGPDLLLEAFGLIHDVVPDVHLVFAGPDGGMLKELEKRVAELGIAHRVHFIGYIEGADKAQAYISSQLLVIPSRHEAMSIVVLEAGVWGTPVLITDQCGFNEVDDVNGGRVVSATVDGLRAGLLDVLEHPNQLAEMGLSLQSHIRKHYEWDSVIGQLLNLYQEVLGGDDS